MKRLALIALALAGGTSFLMGCGTLAQHGTVNPAPIVTPQASASTPAETPPPVAIVPDVPEAKSFDPLGRLLTSQRFVDHAQRSLAIAGATDPIFSNCISFNLDLGKELQAKPLITLPTLALATADPSCPLCLLAAKRKDAEAVESGLLLVRIGEVRGRLRDIRKREAVACAPLLVDEVNMFNRLMALFGGLAGGG